MSSANCPSCNSPYTPGEARYCVKCGEQLPKSGNPVQEIKQIENEPKPYEALRFTSRLIVFLGWLVIIFGWLIAITFGSVISESIANYVVAEDASRNILQNFSALVIVIIGSINTITGIVMIAMGQVFAVLLDIRNDTHTTMRIIRLFGLLMSEK